MSQPLPPSLPVDLLIHCVTPFLRLRTPEGAALLRLRRWSPAQLARLRANMTHREWEFRHDVDQIAERASAMVGPVLGAFTKTILEHAIRPCLRFVRPEGEAPTPSGCRPLVIDTGEGRRLGRDRILMSLLVALLRNASKPLRVAVFTVGKQNTNELMQLLISMVPPTRIMKKNREQLFVHCDDSVHRVYVHSYGQLSSLRGLSADLILCGDIQGASPAVTWDLSPHWTAGTETIMVGRGGMMNTAAFSPRIFDLAHALVPPPYAQLQDYPNADEQ